MKIFRFLLILFLSVYTYGISSLPADITFMIVDYKYSEKRGIKICEVQRAIVSNFSAYDSVYGETNLIYHDFCNFLKHYQNHIWSSVQDLSIKNFVEVCLNNNWNVPDNPRLIFKENSFIKAAKKTPTAPYDLTKYHGAIYGKSSEFGSIREMKSKYPGMLLIDASIMPYQNNKLSISKLFDSDASLAVSRPMWNVYPKKYSKSLSQKITENFKHSKVVIKPHNSTLGRGVIIVEAEDLDKTLKLIFSNKKKLRKKQDNSYRYWLNDKDDSFLVEEFVASDPIAIPHLGNQLFDPTYRSTFILYYHNHETDIHFIEHLVKLPENPLSSKGTLNSKHKTILKQPYYAKVEEAQKVQFEKALTAPLLKMYELMLKQSTIE